MDDKQIIQILKKFNKWDYFYSLLLTSSVEGKSCSALNLLCTDRNRKKTTSLNYLLCHGSAKQLRKFLTNPIVYDCRYKNPKRCINKGKKTFNLQQQPEFTCFYEKVFKVLAAAQLYSLETKALYPKDKTYTLSKRILNAHYTICTNYGDFKFNSGIFKSFPDKESQALYFNVCANDYLDNKYNTNLIKRADTNVCKFMLNNEFATEHDRFWCFWKLAYSSSNNIILPLNIPYIDAENMNKKALIQIKKIESQKQAITKLENIMHNFLDEYNANNIVDRKNEAKIAWKKYCETQDKLNEAKSILNRYCYVF